ncbi:MAG TPA: Nudix family hydrolase [Pseudomonadales bacterium]|nr:Nudix family hydrolase [Pseudomonadales bacterium]
MPNIDPDAPLPVAVAVVRNMRGEILIAQRAAHVHQGGLWEFPGGKIEQGETTQAALKRELFEEIGIEVEPERRLIEILHNYGDKKVHLDVWLCSYAGLFEQTSGLEGQPIRWEGLQQLEKYNFPRANRAILNALLLPAIYLVSPEPIKGQESFFLSALDQSLQQGLQFVQLRATQLNDEEYLALAQRVLVICRQRGASLMIKGLHRYKQLPGAAGLHLTASELKHCAMERHNLRSDCPEGFWLAASCHSPEEIQWAADVGVDFITLSPVESTQSHSDAQPIGWQRFQEWARLAAMPVYAQGGLGPRHLSKAWLMGGQGVAAIRSMWASSV